MKFIKYPLLLCLLAACHRPTPPAKHPIAVSTDTTTDTLTHYPLANDDTESDLRVFDTFKDSVAEQMALTRMQIKHYLHEDTSFADVHYQGHQVKTFASFYLMIIDFQYGTYKLYTIDTVTNKVIDNVVLGFNVESDGDYGGSVCEYSFINDSTVKVVQKDYDPEGNEPLAHTEHTTFNVSREGKIKKE